MGTITGLLQDIQMTQENLSKILTDEAEFCVVDVETTGMSAVNCRIIEIGIVRVRKLKITETYRSFINPGTEVPYFISQLTGISNSDVRVAPFFDEISDIIEEFIGNDIIVGHNVQFDNSFLKKAFESCGKNKNENTTLCTCKLARKIYPELPSKSLGKVVKHLKIRHENVHRALGDATVTAKILIKMIKELKAKHNIQTLPELLNYQYFQVTKASDSKILKKKLIGDLAKLPDHPGVYLFKDAKDKVIYVGKAKSLKNRVKNYFSPTAPSKCKKIITQAARLGFELTNSELTALIAESELIKIHNPKFNIQLKKFGSNYFIKVLRDKPFGSTEVARKFDFDGNDYFGPYTNIDTVIRLQKVIEKTFRLRECKEKEFAQHKGCYLAHIERCLAPCVSESVSDEYNHELLSVYEFLSGKSQSAVNRLIERMKDYSSQHRYEEATEVRDIINVVLGQIHKTSILAEPVNSSNVLIEVKTTGVKDFILMVSGKIHIKDYIIKEMDYFDVAIEDYFGGVVSIQEEVNKKDLEKIKITLNWLIRHRSSVRVFYLKEFSSQQELYRHISYGNSKKTRKPALISDIHNLIEE